MRLAGCRFAFFGSEALRFLAETFGDRTSVLTVRLRFRFDGGGDGERLEGGEDKAESVSSGVEVTSGVCAKLRRERLGACSFALRDDDKAFTTRAVSRDTLDLRILRCMTVPC